MNRRALSPPQPAALDVRPRNWDNSRNGGGSVWDLHPAPPSPDDVVEATPDGIETVDLADIVDTSDVLDTVDGFELARRRPGQERSDLAVEPTVASALLVGVQGWGDPPGDLVGDDAPQPDEHVCDGEVDVSGGPDDAEAHGTDRSTPARRVQRPRRPRPAHARPRRFAGVRPNGRVVTLVVVASVAAVGAWWLVDGDGDAATGDGPAPTLPETIEGAQLRSGVVEGEAEPTPPADAPDTDAAGGEADMTAPVAAEEDAPSVIVVDVRGPGVRSAESFAGPVTDASDEPPIDEPDETVETVDPAVAPSGHDPAAPAVERQILITHRLEPCRFGPTCLVVGFDLVGFDTIPADFVCEFASGSRFSFPLPSASVATACATGSVGDTVTIEVDGLRSETAIFA